MSASSGSERRRRARGRRPATAAGDLVGALIKDLGLTAAVREARLVAAWRDIVGPRVAARAWPDGLDDGVLHVRVATSAWMQELGFLRTALLERIAAVLGPPPLCRDIRLHLGGNRARPDDVVAVLAKQRRRPRPEPPPLTPEHARAIDAETAAVADAELGGILRDLRRRLGL